MKLLPVTLRWKCGFKPKERLVGFCEGGYNWFCPDRRHSLGISLLLLLLWIAPRVRSATGCQQSPEWSVLGQVDCVSP